MKLSSTVLLIICFTFAIYPEFLSAAQKQPSGYTGSATCRECHEKFYELWATSRHGLAMQAYTAAFAQKELLPQKKDIIIGKYRYRAEIGPKAGYVTEIGSKGTKRYRIKHVTGGKNVYYFLTLLDKGRLQTLPVAYDVQKKEWFDTAGSGLRHFPGERRPDASVDWREGAYTFNTACYNCHVSQIRSNYDPATETYHTTWTEPGINCETCHGPAEEHVLIAKKTPKGQPLPELKIIRTKTMTAEQRNHLCATCHAKMMPLTSSFMPGERFFDHFDLVTLEDSDFYPDGRDLGENYTYTTWLMSPCAKSGKIDCMHCHTTSGRYRFRAEEKANEACIPCHADRVKNATTHTRHKADSVGNKCVSCHMPMTAFARMKRTDHSMLPPTPASTLTFKSPNACNICHSDRDAAWADTLIREWRSRDYQAPVLKRASLIDAARKQDWEKLSEMLEYIQGKDRDEVFSASLIRLMSASEDDRISPALLKAVKDPSPLVRSAAIEALKYRPSPDVSVALLQAAGDDFRVVRIRAAEGLAGYPKETLKPDEAKRLEKAEKEYLAFLMARPDHWSSHYNMGNHHLSRGAIKESIESYKTALKLESSAIMASVNMSMAYARLGDSGKAEETLRSALKIAPENAAANFNMGLLKAEQKDLAGAEKHLKTAFKADSRMAQAAYNLCIITAKDRIEEAITWCRKAAEINSQEPRYAYTLAFYQEQEGRSGEAVKTLEGLIARHPAHPDSYFLLGGIYEKQGRTKEAETVYTRALSAKGVPAPYLYRIKARLDALKGTNEMKK